jgi:hypothetical protein
MIKYPGKRTVADITRKSRSVRIVFWCFYWNILEVLAKVSTFAPYILYMKLGEGCLHKGVGEAAKRDEYSMKF